MGTVAIIMSLIEAERIFVTWPTKESHHPSHDGEKVVVILVKKGLRHTIDEGRSPSYT